MLFQIRLAFGFNTNLFETNILNLSVVVVIVVTVVGDALSTLLDQRRKTILVTVQEIDKKIRDAQKRLEDAQKSVENARLRAKEIRIQAIQTVDLENSKAKLQLKEDLRRLQRKSRQELQLERQRVVQSTTKKIVDLSLALAENILLERFKPQGAVSPRQNELNEIHIKKTFCQLKPS
jgi:F-type H+-transporting ATPase subunit b